MQILIIIIAVSVSIIALIMLLNIIESFVEKIKYKAWKNNIEEEEIGSLRSEFYSFRREVFHSLIILVAGFTIIQLIQRIKK